MRLLSIITAVRNGAPSIGKTLLSVREQSYSAIEHVVIDGASTDGTLDVVRELGTHVARVMSERDRGVYDAFNKGLNLCTGDVVAYLNAGDFYVDRDVLARVMGRFERRPVDAVYGDVDITDAAGSKVLRRYSSAGFSKEKLCWGYMPAHPAFFMRRSVYERLGGYDDTYRIGGDFELMCRAFGTLGMSSSHIPEVLARMPVGGLSNSGWRSKWRITRDMRRACRENNIQTNWVKLLARLPRKYFEEVFARN